MCALSNFGTCLMDDHIFDIAIAVDFHSGPRILLVSKRESDILETGGKASAMNYGVANR